MSKPFSRAHPSHGVSPGDQIPNLVICYIEIEPADTIKYEIDKISGLLKVDRPQKFSNICPTLYGFMQDDVQIPITYGAQTSSLHYGPQASCLPMLKR